MVASLESEALRKKLTELQSLLDLAPDLIFRLDRKLRIVFVNQRVLDVTGLSREECLGKTNRELKMPEALCDLLDKTYLAVFREGQAQEIEFTYPSTQGPIHFHMRVVPEKAPGGAVLTAVGISRDVTEQKQSQLALKESEEKYRTLVEQSLEGIVIAFGPTPKLVFANSSLAGLLGYTVGELLAMSTQEISELIHPDDREMFFGNFTDRISGKQVPSRYEIRGLAKDKRELLCDVKSSLINYLGKPAIQAVFTDITEQKRMEEELQQSEANLNIVLDTLPAGVLIADAKGRIIRDNAVSRELWGVPPNTDSWEAYGNWIGWRPETGERIKAEEWAMTRALLYGEETRDELIQNQRFGSHERRYYLNNVAPLRDVDGKITGGVAAMVDVTERLAAEQALRESEESFRAFLAASSDVVYRMSPDWSRMHQLQGRNFIPDTEEPNNGWLEKYIHPDDQPHMQAVINEAIRTKSIFELEHRVVRVDGTLGWTLSRAVPKLDGKGEIVEWIGVARDITDRKEMYDELRRSRDELEFRVRERTTDLQEKSLQLEDLTKQLYKEIEERIKFEEDLKSKNKKIIQEQNRRRFLSKKLVETLEKDRNTIADTLHDEVGQMLSTISMDLDFLKENLDKKDPAHVNEIDKIQHRIQTSMETISNLCRGLRSHVLDHLGLVPALKSLLEDIQERSKVACHFFAKETERPLDREKAVPSFGSFRRRS